MPTPAFIDGVLVRRNIFSTHCDWMLTPRSHLRFHYHRYPFPHSALKPGLSSPSIPVIHQLLHLNLRILYLHPPHHPEKTRNLALDPYFFGYWAASPLRHTAYMVIFRDDLLPLHPKQVKVLWEFCDGGFVARDRVEEYFGLLPGGFVGVGDLVEVGKGTRKAVEVAWEVWRVYCSVDNFCAFFERYRRRELVKGHEGWREVVSL